MTIVVTGGRTYSNINRVNYVLDTIHKEHKITKLIHGNAPGADSLCAAWGFRNGIEVKGYPAEWDKYGNKAGPIRNRQMIDMEHTPPEQTIELCVVFPGMNGTKHMSDLCATIGIPLTFEWDY